MRVGVVRETAPHERRVALVPELVGTLAVLGYEVALEPGAGLAAGFADEEYDGARTDPRAVEQADVVLAVRAPAAERLRPDAALFCLRPPAPQPVAALAARGVRLYSMELVPRISRAQPMDALTSQSLVAGYRAVVVAAELYDGLLPLTVTAAGTLPAARVLVLGTGVAGLQAIATARRLGAQVSAYDVRPSSAEEIRSLGAVAVDLGLEPLSGAGGYAREMTPARAVAQQRLLAPHVAAADILITTAAVPGRAAPLLVTAAMVAGMRPGSVVVDLAAEQGGNVEGVVAGEVVRVGGVRLWGGRNVPSQLPMVASRLYARNVVQLLTLMTRDGRFDPDPTDEIISACLVDVGRVDG